MRTKEALSYDDVLLQPRRSDVDSRSDVDISTTLGDVELDIPILSTPMDTVTGTEMAKAVCKAGGMGVIHRFVDPEEQAEMLYEASSVDTWPIGAAVGINEQYLDRVRKLAGINIGPYRADMIMVDVAHGHMERCLEAVEMIAEEIPDGVTLAAGNVATRNGTYDLIDAGADVVKVGIGPGSLCTTREVAGVGVPQLTAVERCARLAHGCEAEIIADGGIRSSGDAVKALMAGADAVMMGSFFMGSDEAPGEIIHAGSDGGIPRGNDKKYKRVRGMASRAAAEDRDDKDTDVTHEEGVETTVEYTGPIKPQIEEFAFGIRSGLSYLGGHTIEEARDHARFIEVTPATRNMNGAHKGER